MFTTKIKIHAKSNFKENSKFYLKISSKYLALYFLVIVIPFIPKIIDVIVSRGFVFFNLNIVSNNIFVNIIFNLLYSALIIIFSIKIYVNESRVEKSQKFSNEFRVKIIKFSSIIILLQLPFIVSSSIISAMLLQSVIGISFLSVDSIKLIQAFLSLLRIILDILFYFAICSFSLYPDKSIKNTLNNSVKLIIKNLSSWLTFELSFILWYLIPYILMVVTLVLLGRSPLEINEQKNMLLISLITFLNTPLVFGLGLFFFPYYHISKFNFYKIILANSSKT